MFEPNPAWRITWRRRISHPQFHTPRTKKGDASNWPAGNGKGIRFFLLASATLLKTPPPTPGNPSPNKRKKGATGQRGCYRDSNDVCLWELKCSPLSKHGSALTFFERLIAVLLEGSLCTSIFVVGWAQGCTVNNDPKSGHGKETQGNTMV